MESEIEAKTIETLQSIDDTLKRIEIILQKESKKKITTADILYLISVVYLSLGTGVWISNLLQGF